MENIKLSSHGEKTKDRISYRNEERQSTRRDQTGQIQSNGIQHIGDKKKEKRETLEWIDQTQ